MCGTDCFLMVIALLFAPLPVWVKRGICSADSIINIALCCLGVLPGVIHSWYIILKYPDQYDGYEHVRQDGERGDGSVTYYYVARGPAGQRQGGQQPHPSNYGTVGNQPSGGQFPGQQSGVTNSFPQPKNNVQASHGVAGQELGGSSQGGEGSSQPPGPPPTYADVIKGDHKVQDP